MRPSLLIQILPLIPFAPQIISGFGFNSQTTILLNIPFGFLQFIVIMLAVRPQSPALPSCPSIVG
jgi:hypothetical protein